MRVTRCEYRVCQVQESRVTYVNGDWQGTIAPTQNVREAVSSCLLEWEFLNSAGADGWELVSATGSVGGDTNARVLYLRREQD